MEGKGSDKDFLFDPFWTETFHIVLGETKSRPGRVRDVGANESRSSKRKRRITEKGRGYDPFDPGTDERDVEEEREGSFLDAEEGARIGLVANGPFGLENRERSNYVGLVRKLVNSGGIPPSCEYDRLFDLLFDCREAEDLRLAMDTYVLLMELHAIRPPTRLRKDGNVSTDPLAWAPVDGIERAKMSGMEEEHAWKKGIAHEWERWISLLRDAADLLEQDDCRPLGKVLAFQHYAHVLMHDLRVREMARDARRDDGRALLEECMLWRLLGNAQPVGRGSIRDAIECMVRIMISGTESRMNKSLTTEGSLQFPSQDASGAALAVDPLRLGRQAGLLLGAVLRVLGYAEEWEEGRGIRMLGPQRLEADGTLGELFRTKLNTFESKERFLMNLRGKGLKRRLIGTLFAFGMNKKVANRVAPSLSVSSSASPYNHIPVLTEHILAYVAADVPRALNIGGDMDGLLLVLEHLVQADLEEEGPSPAVASALEEACRILRAHSDKHSTSRNVFSVRGNLRASMIVHCVAVAGS